MASSPVPTPQDGEPIPKLRDLHLPTDIDSWPPAIGWWLLAAVAIGVAGFLLWKLWQYWRANSYRREGRKALLALKASHSETGDIQAWLLAFNDLLKRVALTGYSREQVASLSGEAWVAFLDRTMGSHEFSMGAGQVLIDGSYKAEVSADVEALHQLGLQWISKHRKRLPEQRP
ncbi:MAG: DUF4381 domain-containing protein [Pseudomonadales bacterium]|nr:DUF4381 domain-containing protein [Pseudomonadales bacterium]